MTNTLAFPFLLPFFAGALGFVFRTPSYLRRALFALFSFLQVAASIYVFCHVYSSGPQALFFGNWPPPASIALTCDLLSASMSVMTSVLGVVCLLFGFAEFSLKEERSMRLPFFSLITAGVQLSFLTGDLFNLYVSFEVLLASSYALMCLEAGKEQLKHTFSYIGINLLGTAIFLFGIGLTYSLSGTLNMADLSRFFQENSDQPLVLLTIFLIMFVFLLKGAVYPLCYWLPESYPVLSFSSVAFFSGILTKVGVYDLLRLLFTFLNGIPPLLSEMLLFVSGLSMVLGALGALSKDSIKGILAYHSISQIGYIIFTIASGSLFGIRSALFFMFHHSLVKSSLFLIGGAAAKGVKSENIYKMGGVYDYSPFLSFLFFIQALSLAGLPPLSGFWAKYFSITSGLQQGNYTIVGIALFTSLLTLMSMIKIWHYGFWTKEPYRKLEDFPFTASVRNLTLCGLVLTLLTLSMGFFVEWWLQIFEKVSVELLEPSNYTKTVFPMRS